MPAANLSPDIRSGAFNIDEAAHYVRLNRFTLYRLVNRGEGPRVVRIGRRVLFRPSDLDAWLEARTA